MSTEAVTELDVPQDVESADQQDSAFENPQQAVIFEVIASHIAEFGWAPTVREICERTGLRSTSTVHHHLRRLEELGLIVRGSRQSRATSVGRAAA